MTSKKSTVTRITRPKRSSRNDVRTSSSARVFRRIPEIMEDIQVAWEVNGKIIWWTADVISVEPALNHSTPACGTIRYRAQRRYNAEEHEVVFNPVSKKGTKTLRHTSGGCGSSSTSTSAWIFSEEPPLQSTILNAKTEPVLRESVISPSSSDGEGKSKKQPPSRVDSPHIEDIHNDDTAPQTVSRHTSDIGSSSTTGKVIPSTDVAR